MSAPLFYKEEAKRWLLTTFQKHNWKSGEILLAFEEMGKKSGDAIADVIPFLERYSITHTCQRFSLEVLSKAEAVSAIDYGLSVKPNYTCVDMPFDAQKRLKIASVFMGLFSNSVKYYTLPEGESFYRTRDTRSDFVECGGCLAVDEVQIGLLWITDFY